MFRYLNCIKYIFQRTHKMQYEIIHCHVIDKFYFQNKYKIIFPIYLYVQVLRRHHIQIYELFNYFSHLHVKIFLSILALYGNCDLMCNNTSYTDFINIHLLPFYYLITSCLMTLAASGRLSNLPPTSRRKFATHSL